MCPFQFGELECGRRHGDPSAPELVFRPVCGQAGPGEDNAHQQPGWGPFRGPFLGFLESGL